MSAGWGLALAAGSCERLPFRYLREWLNPSMREFPDYVDASPAANEQAETAVFQNLPPRSRIPTLQSMFYQCQSVVNSCSFQAGKGRGEEPSGDDPHLIPMLSDDALQHRHPQRRLLDIP